MNRCAQLRIILALGLVTATFNCVAQTAAQAGADRQKALALEEQSRYPEAEDAWHAFLKVHPANAEGYAHLGFLEARQGHYAEAAPLYRKALALNPGMPGLRLNLGLSLFKSGAMKAAIETFTPLLKGQPASSPEAVRLNTLIGMAHYGLGEYEAAIPFLRQATNADPQNLPYRLLLAHSCLWSKQYQCVLDVYHEILTLNAESAEADMLAGEALDEMKDHAGATLQFRAAVKANPHEPDVHFGLGYLLWSQNQLEEAAQEFQEELNNVPTHAVALAFLADCDMQLGHPETARPLLEKAIRIDPAMERAHLDLGILDADAGQREDAVQELKIAAKLVPDDVNVHWRLARLYQAMGKKDLAKVEFDKTNNLHKAANETIINELHRAQSQGKPADAAAEPQLKR